MYQMGGLSSMHDMYVLIINNEIILCLLLPMVTEFWIYPDVVFRYFIQTEIYFSKSIYFLL